MILAPADLRRPTPLFQQAQPQSQRHSHLQSLHFTPHIQIPPTQPWSFPSATPTVHPHQPLFVTANDDDDDDIYSFGADPAVFDFEPEQYSASQQHPASLMPHTDAGNQNWSATGQLTPTSTTRAQHHRESSLSSLGSPAPNSPFSANTSNPHIVNDVYDAYQASNPLTPAHTPVSQEFLSPYTGYYPTLPYAATALAQDGLPKLHGGDTDGMPAPEFHTHASRPSMTSMASTVSRDSPATPPASYEEERQNIGEIANVDCWLNEYLQSCDDPAAAYPRTVPKLTRTITDAYSDELYHPSLQFAPTVAAPAAPASPPRDVFAQRLQAANSQHLSAGHQTPLTMPAREKSPFRQGSPLAPVPSQRFGPDAAHRGFSRLTTASAVREHQKAESDARALQQQMHPTPEDEAPKTISPKDVDLVYQESDEDAQTPLFPPAHPPRASPGYHHPPPAAALVKEETEDTASLQSYGSMVTSRRESSSAYSTTSQAPPYHFPTSASVRPLTQFFPVVSPPARAAPPDSAEFPASVHTQASSSSDAQPEHADRITKPAGTSAETGTYTCTYHGCTLRFETPAKLQRHKREGHRNSTMLGSGADHEGMTSAGAAKAASQAGPHKCERINPSSGKPCNTIFSRPYDLTRHEDTIHNARKQKSRCPYCTEEKTFSRYDALTRHYRVCHPHVQLPGKHRKRNLAAMSKPYAQ
jgi:protein RPN4